MKKITFFLAVAGACLLASCAKTIEQPAPEEAVTASKVVTYINANGNENGAKAAIDNDAKFTWRAGDQIAVYAGGEYKFSDALAEGGNASAAFAFSGANAINEADRANFALYPASLAKDPFGDPVSDGFTASDLVVNLPASYNLSDIKDQKSPVFMIAANAPDAGLAFKQLGALLRFKLVNVPKQTQYITFDFQDKRVQGEFTLTGVEAGTTAIVADDTPDEDDIIIHISQQIQGCVGILNVFIFGRLIFAFAYKTRFFIYFIFMFIFQQNKILDIGLHSSADFVGNNLIVLFCR